MSIFASRLFPSRLLASRLFASGLLASKLGLAFVVVTLCLGGRAAHAQAAPVTYWIPDWSVGVGANMTAGQSTTTYGDFPSLDGSDARGAGFSYRRYNFPSGWFVGREGGGVGLNTGLNVNGLSQNGAFGNVGSLYYEGAQFGYNFKSAGGLPVTVFAGFDTLKYNSGIGSPYAPFNATSGTLPGYSAHAGVEFQPAPNLSLSLGVGYTQQSGRLDSTVNSFSLSGGH